MYKKGFSIPFAVFIVAGTIIPLCLIAFYGFTDRSGAFTFTNIMAIFEHDHIKALALALLFAFISTLVCLMLSLPLALILRNSRLSKKGFMVFIFVLPMWMNFLLRTMAWQVLLERGGLINALFQLVSIPNIEISLDRKSVV